MFIECFHFIKFSIANILVTLNRYFPLYFKVPSMQINTDQVLCECPKEHLVQWMASIESSITIEMVIEPKLCMTMVQAEDSIDFQPFYLGEVLMTECQLHVDGKIGYGYCMGDEPQRAYCIAIADAILNDLNHLHHHQLLSFLESEKNVLLKNKMEEHHQIMKTKVDFKIMEQD